MYKVEKSSNPQYDGRLPYNKQTAYLVRRSQ
jgi:hypothetical protein